MRRSLLLLPILLLLQPARAQLRVFIALEAGVTHEPYQRTDPAGDLRKLPLNAALIGFALRQELKRHLFVESGLLYKSYNAGISFRSQPDAWGSGTAFHASLLPLRFGRSFNLIKDRLTAEVLVGPVIGLRTDGELDTSYTYGSFVSLTDSIGYSYSLVSQKQFALFQGGVGIGCRISGRLYFSLSGSYYAGPKEVWTQQIRYRHLNGPVREAEARSHGSFALLGASLRLRMP